jgi:TolA-binding protein
MHPKVAGERRALAVAPSPGELAFVEGWSAFRAGRFGGAINAFDDVLRLDPSGQLAEDARYWRAVALARTSSPEAAEALRGFLRQYPRSGHAAEAESLLQGVDPQ